MRRIACIFLLTCAAATPLAAQTRNIAHAGHSGSGTAEDEDHFGETPQMKAMWRHYSDSVRNAEQAAAQQRRPIRIVSGRGQIVLPRGKR